VVTGEEEGRENLEIRADDEGEGRRGRGRNGWDIYIYTTSLNINRVSGDAARQGAKVRRKPGERNQVKGAGEGQEDGGKREEGGGHRNKGSGSKMMLRWGVKLETAISHT
jgi:hypothetical protein